MSAHKQITIVGGGLAGLALGIGLRQREVPVTLYEAGRYPRHRVCGEFISGRGVQVLQRLGLPGALDKAGARAGRTSQFFIGERPLPTRELPTPALCISRFTLDAMLADEFRNLGGELRTGTRWTEPTTGEGIVRSTGRRVQGEQDGARWFGLKGHVRKVTLQADLEMHFAANSYVGLCRLPGGEVNVCGLFRRAKTDAPLPQHAVQRLCVESSSILSERLRDAAWDPDSFCSVGGLAFRGQLEPSATEFRIGDAMAMIPPVTGNGMSMAFESASLAVEPLAGFSNNRVSWDEAIRLVTGQCKDEFCTRLQWAGWLHTVLFQPLVRSRLLPIVASSEMLWRIFFRLTR